MKKLAVILALLSLLASIVSLYANFSTISNNNSDIDINDNLDDTTSTSGNSSSDHVHEFKIIREPTCTRIGLEECICGEIIKNNVLGHEFDGCFCLVCGYENHTWDTSDIDCQQQATCFDCEAEGGPYGSHVDYNKDDKCDLCLESI